MVPTGNKAKRFSSVNHTAKTIHHHQPQHRTIITPMHFLSTNARTGLPTLMIPEEEDDDPNFRLKEPKSAEKLLETWKKRSKIPWALLEDLERWLPA